ncbi:hypothetical protein [Vibrio sp. WXL103]|uniref:hypothetical protein n=1 Tax=Vibrio sp. WXL103 TaxID=3450710 RepID=UPI003EC5250A
MMILVDNYPCAKYDQTLYAPEYNESLLTRTILIPGGGCAYYRAKKGNACTFCAFPEATRQLTQNKNDIENYSSWRLNLSTYKKMWDLLLSNSKKLEKVSIFNGGSFFPNSELQNDFQTYVYQSIQKHPTIKQLFIECYPNFISKQKLLQAKQLLGNKDLMIGIGYESNNEHVRNNLLNKGINQDTFENKVKLMKSLGIKVSVYVFLKAPELSEQEAYDDVINTLRYLSSLAVDHISLSCAFVPPGTKLESLYKVGAFKPPWLWTIIAIEEQAKKHGWPLVIGGFDDTPPPIAGPANCSKCNEQVLGIIEQSRQHGVLTYDLLPDCECKTQWENELATPTPQVKLIVN